MCGRNRDPVIQLMRPKDRGLIANLTLNCCLHNAGYNPVLAIAGFNPVFTTAGYNPVFLLRATIPS